MVVVGAHEAKVEAEFAPGDELVEKRFGGGAEAPPTGAAAVGTKSDAGGRPLFVFDEGGENLVRRDVAEMKIGGEFAGGALGRLIAGVGVRGKLFAKKRFEKRLRGGGAAAECDGRNGMVDGNFGEGASASVEKRGRGRGPARCDFAGKRFSARESYEGERMRIGKVEQMRF